MANKTSQSQIKASLKYNTSNTKRVYISLNTNTDKDIIDMLEKISNKQGYIKELIRRDIAEK